MANVLTSLFGTKYERDLRDILPLLHRVNEKELWAQQIQDEDFGKETERFRKELAGGTSPDDLLPEAFALAREAARRKLGERPYDVQILGGIVLHQGKIMELKTGEGKTLASVAPAYLNALTGKGVHLVTVNDYLAERDANWMRPVYDLLGISVGAILSNMAPEARQVEYSKDITYGTNNEFGFDYLRDNMNPDINKIAQKQHHYAIIDEIDSILIDEARTPLIISGSVDEDTSKYNLVNKLIRFFKEVEKDPETGDYPLEDPMGHTLLVGDYKLDEKSKRIMFTDDGMNKMEEILHKNNMIKGSLFDEENFEFLHYFTQAMKAHHLFHSEKDYLVQDGVVQIVDEFTGRVLQGRRYSDGLHQAIEAKENIKVARKNKTLATITFQNYFRMYEKISGMTGTADTEAREFTKIYNLDVVVVPTNRPLHRDDVDDVIYLHEKYKFEAICETIKEVNATGQPILVGTISVEKSEVLSKLLRAKGVKHEILNAKNHGREAFIISEAGAEGSVTIATNMAGRGTDIKLGGNPEARTWAKVGTDASKEVFDKAFEEEMVKWRKDNQRVKDLGGLYVIGSERHESRRIDNQLRGRSGRQGDPGYSQFFISLDDDLMRLFGGEKFKNTMKSLGFDGDEPLHHKMINNSLERAQKKVEDRNYEIRKHLLDYDDVLNKQRTYIYNLRNEILTEKDLTKKILTTGEEILEVLLLDYKSDSKGGAMETAFLRLQERLKENLGLHGDALTNLQGLEGEALSEKIHSLISQDLEEKKQLAGQEQLDWFIRAEYLRNIDRKWQEHLEALEALREAVYLRSYAQKNPLVEYKNEGFAIFSELIDDMRIAIARKVFQVKIRRESTRTQPGSHGPKVTETHNTDLTMGGLNKGPQKPAIQATSGQAIQIKRTDPKVGRNDPCPCGSGKKYKKCCGS